MKIAGQSLVIPLVDTELRYCDSIELGKGIHVIRLTPQYRERLQKEDVLVGGYQGSISNIHIGLSIEPSNSYPNKQLSLNDSLRVGIFISLLLRLVTDIPIDVPFWFDVSSQGQILGVGQTKVRTYRHVGQHYTYLLDEGRTFERIKILRPYTLKFVEYFIDFPDTNRIIKAIEFASIGFQMFHIPTRLVNQVMFMEILFSCDIQELTFQLSSRISWYLRYSNSPSEREEVYNTVKNIYGMRSKVVHGASAKNPKNLRTQMRKILEESEILNSEIFREILKRNHIELCSSKNRDEHLRKLSLGLPCDFI